MLNRFANVIFAISFIFGLLMLALAALAFVSKAPIPFILALVGALASMVLGWIVRYILRDPTY